MYKQPSYPPITSSTSRIVVLLDEIEAGYYLLNPVPITADTCGGRGTSQIVLKDWNLAPLMPSCALCGGGGVSSTSVCGRAAVLCSADKANSNFMRTKVRI